MTAHSPRIVILGAGYAGMMAALRLSGKTRKLETSITLINGEGHFVQRPRLHHLATNQATPQTSISTMLRDTRVRFVLGWVTGLELGEHRVNVSATSGIEHLTYDYLFYALGSAVDQGNVPGVREHAFVIDPHGPNGAEALRQRLLAQCGAGRRVVVVGGGPTGIEGATEIKGRFPALQVSLVTDGPFGAFKGALVEHHFRAAFAEQHIAIHEGQAVRAVEAGHLRLADGTIMPFDLCLWAAGFRASPLARDAGLHVNERVQVVTDRLGRSVSHPEIYAVGDAAGPLEVPRFPMRMSLGTALTSGAHAADNLTRRLQGRPETPLRLVYYGQGIAMGPKDAVGFFGYPDDTVRGPILRGNTAVAVRNFFVWLIFYMLELERRKPGFYFWPGQARPATGGPIEPRTPRTGPQAARGS